MNYEVRQRCSRQLRASDAGLHRTQDIVECGIDGGFARQVQPSMSRDQRERRRVQCSAACHVVSLRVICSNPVEHRQRIVSRSVDIADLPLPGWPEVLDYDYQPWNRDHIVLDTAGESPDESLHRLLRSPEFSSLGSESR
ncbi:hypothetical protein [Nocardia sp. NPDC050175]|uniref:hypothetical protein n=1 Tax=Nocardia sp. NPDC050175 TaxID=3364317 RepID=UPI00379DFAFD